MSKGRLGYKIVGRTALNYHLGKVKNTDLDIWYDNEKPIQSNFDVKLDYSKMPSEIIDSFQDVCSMYASLEDLLAIKMSHLTYDIFFRKHLQDLLFIKSKTNGLYNKKLYNLLQKHWKVYFKNNKSVLSLYKSKKEFFDDKVVKYYDHDYLHECVAFGAEPLYKKCLKNNQEVFLDKNKFKNLDFNEKINMFKEEIMVIALERWIIPKIKSNKLISINESWNNSLHKTIVSLTKNWASYFIIENIEHFIKPEFEQINKSIKKIEGDK